MAQKGETVAGRYRLLDKLGAGALGEVWAARDDHTERELALKLLRPNWEVAAKSRESFFRELKAAAKIRHVSIVELIDTGETEIDGVTVPFVAMELLEAEKLEELLERAGTIPVGTALRLISDLAWALVAAHEKTIVHERIEPANILLHRDVRGEIVPKLVDFGVARLIEDLEVLPGTPHEALSPMQYLSPEQIHADVELDGRADVFGLAALFHRCIVGSPPFDGPSPDEILEQVEEGPKKLEPYEPPIDNKVIQLISDALQRNRKLRPTMRVFAERVDALRERIEAQWREFSRQLQIPDERTIDHIAKLRPARAVAKVNLVKRAETTPIVTVREEMAPLSPKVDPREEHVESMPDSAPPVSIGERLSSSELEEAPPSIDPSKPPPLPKPGLEDAPPVSEIIREKLRLSNPGALSLDVLQDLEKELLKHVARDSAVPESKPTPPPPETGLFKEGASVPPPNSDLLYAPAAESERAPKVAEKKKKKVVEEDEEEAPRREKKSLPHATAKTVPPHREEEKKSGAVWIVAALAALVLVGIIVIQRTEDASAGSGGQPSATAPAQPSPAPTPTLMPGPQPTAAIVELPTVTAAPTVTAPPIASTTAAPVATTAAPPATTAMPATTTTAAPPATTTKPVAAPTAKPAVAPTAKPTATATATATATETAAPKPTNDPTFGVDNAGF